MAKKSMMGTGAALAFLGSLVYLYLAFTWTGPAAWIGGTTSTFAYVLVPLAATTAVISAVSLFLLSIGAYAWKSSDEKMMWATKKAAYWGGFALVLLTGGSGGNFYLAVLGFLLAYIGSGMLSM